MDHALEDRWTAAIRNAGLPSQSELARRIGVQSQVISQLKSGAVQHIRVWPLVCAELNASKDWLQHGTGQPPDWLNEAPPAPPPAPIPADIGAQILAAQERILAELQKISSVLPVSHDPASPTHDNDSTDAHLTKVFPDHVPPPKPAFPPMLSLVLAKALAT